MKRRLTTHEVANLGRVLIETKQRLAHGEFLAHLADTGIGTDTAERCMRVARYVDDDPNILDLMPSMAYRVAAARPDQHTIAMAQAALRQQWREKDIEDAVMAHLHSQGIPATRQVVCPAGVIDIVTPDAVYEVERFLSRDVFFHAIGQVLIYRQAFDPTRRAVIVGLPDPGTSLTELADYACQFGVDIELWSVPATNTAPATIDTLAWLQEIAASLEALAAQAATLPPDGATEQALKRAAMALEAIQRTVAGNSQEA